MHIGLFFLVVAISRAEMDKLIPNRGPKGSHQKTLPLIRPLSESLSSFFAQITHPSGFVHLFLPANLLKKLYEMKDGLLSHAQDVVDANGALTHSFPLSATEIKH
ncbi:uncharacterized protein LOC116161382 [Photinus pyralis]|uniref:uncharacterized protein LOC116161382 n=1 Tax=Photinus pyralis TaxID=7054 RepID=UPI001267606F|nr:uncharacterized protein LOC116161382 [Photinus pyralis]